MTRRITIPEDHVALILPNQVADELSDLMRMLRSECRAAYARVEAMSRNDDLDHRLEPIDADSIKHARYEIAGDVMLALLEAREA